jgi:uncharacterized protein
MVRRRKDRKRSRFRKGDGPRLLSELTSVSNPEWDVESNMRLHSDAVLLRAFIGEDDTCGSVPLYQAIVLKAREMHLAGATVFCGPLGFGHSSKIHSTSLFRLSRDLPVVIEIVDSQEKIDSFLPILSEIMPGGVVTLERAKILKYGPGHTRSDLTDPLHK